ncbi:MAG: CopG family transcriptional regulator [Thermoprotei archaeon]|nr:MAG: CopG family transcriptional regulator [Thermoprotei archaeon]
MSKRRFGVSIPEELAHDLDRLAEIIGCDRSKLVTEAVREYVHEHVHYTQKHRCLGVLICVRMTSSESRRDVVDKYHSVVKSYSHIHVGRLCIEIYVVEGDSNEIVKLHSELSRKMILTRYVSLPTKPLG